MAMLEAFKKLSCLHEAFIFRCRQMQNFEGYDALSHDVLRSVDRAKFARSDLLAETIVADLFPYESSFLFHIMSLTSYLYLRCRSIHLLDHEGVSRSMQGMALHPILFN